MIETNIYDKEIDPGRMSSSGFGKSVAAPIFITGGILRQNASKLEQGHRYQTAVIQKISVETAKTQTIFRYVTPPELCPADHPSIQFTCASVQDKTLYAPTSTEVLILQLPDMGLVKRISQPFFHNIHHVAVMSGYLGVVSTGLDMVVLLDKETYEPKRFINTLMKDPWHGFSKDIDYRRIVSTKPHASHPNFLFEIDGDIWVTRFEQRDAVNLDSPGKRIDIAVERCHDGIVQGDFIYFTTVDGHVVVAHKGTCKVEAVFDLRAMEGRKGNLGWCRGLHVDGDSVLVGYSVLRNTVWKDNLRWVKGCLRNGSVLPKSTTRVAKYNLATGAFESEIGLSGIDSVFSIIAVKG